MKAWLPGSVTTLVSAWILGTFLVPGANCQEIFLSNSTYERHHAHSTVHGTLAFIHVPLPRDDEPYLAKEMMSSIGMKLMRMDAGTFIMGSPKDEPERNAIEIQHEVVISKSFYIGKFHVTQQEYEQVIGLNPSQFKADGKNAKIVGNSHRFPVECVKWNDAKEFCRRLTQKDRAAGKLARDMTYTLPTEAEFEYCQRAGTMTPFHCGTTLSTDQCNYNGTMVYAHGQIGINRNGIVETGSFKPNAWGLHDMHGNVCQWCEDWYDAQYYKNSPRVDPRGPEKREIRVLRGGCWNYHPRDCRSACRDGLGPEHANNTIGFRVVLRLSWPSP